MDMYYYVLHDANLFAMASIYVNNFMIKVPKSEEKVYTLSHFDNIDHCHLNLRLSKFVTYV